MSEVNPLVKIYLPFSKDISAILAESVDFESFSGIICRWDLASYYLKYESPLKTPIFKKIGQLGEISINKNNNLQR